MISLDLKIAEAIGLDPKENERIEELINVFNEHADANEKKRKYYEGHISLNEVNLGLALPNGIAKLEIGCAWGEKAVDVLASRSMFDGFVGKNGDAAE